MLVQIPVVIAFDSHHAATIQSRSAGYKVFTLRYDTNPDIARAAEYCDHYPPRDNAIFRADADGIFFDLFTASADKTITKRATDDPETYSVTEGAR
jgi:hypothetical protein